MKAELCWVMKRKMKVIPNRGQKISKCSDQQPVIHLKGGKQGLRSIKLDWLVRGSITRNLMCRIRESMFAFFVCAKLDQSHHHFVFSLWTPLFCSFLRSSLKAQVEQLLID